MPLDTRQKVLPSSLSPQPCFEDIPAQTPLPELSKLFAAELQARSVQPSPFQSLLSSHDKEFCGKQFSRFDLRNWCAAVATTTPHGGALESSQKRLMIFDQSGNQTRLIRCPFPLRFQSPAAAEPVKLSEFDEKYINGKESEMHEDTEEINALLYSDDEYDDDDCESDDEVMSTGHSPYPIEKVCNKREPEETNAPCKRRKLLDNVNNIRDSSSLVDTKLDGSSFLKDDEKLPESNISTKEDTGSHLSNEQSRKDKIRTALKILESIVPGAKGNEALLLLNEAIDYLKLLKRDLISTEIKNHC